MPDDSTRRAAEKAAAAAEEAAAAAQEAAKAARKAAEEQRGSDDVAAPAPGEGAQDGTPYAPARGTDKTGEYGEGEGGL